MARARRVNKWIKQTFWSVLGALIVGYFLYHTIQGERGWFAMLRVQSEVSTAEKALSKLQKDRQDLQHRTDLLRDKSMDPDLLEEESRKLLNYSKPNEIIILTPQDKKPQK